MPSLCHSPNKCHADCSYSLQKIKIKKQAKCSFEGKKQNASRK